MTISIGYAHKSVTPSLERPVFLAGFERNRRAESVHDDLSVRVLALQDQHSSLALVALDLIGLGRKISQAYREKLSALLPGLQLVLSCTHTHHGPDTLGLWGPEMLESGVDPAYMAFLEYQVADAIQQAFSHLAPAALRASSVHVPGIVKNIRDPHILDQELTCIQYVDPDSNRVHLTLLNFPCHPETLHPDNRQITADYPHFLREQVECLTQADCLFFSGALGGMMTPDVTEHSFEDAQQIGVILAQAAVDSLSRQPPLQLDGFQYDRVEYSTPLESPLLEQAMQANLVTDSVISRGYVISEAGLLRLGQVWLAHVPGELLPALGLQLKHEMRAAGASVCGILGLANDELGYILPDDKYHYPENPLDPGQHYEETMSVGPSAGLSLIRVFDTLIHPNYLKETSDGEVSNPGR